MNFRYLQPLRPLPPFEIRQVDPRVDLLDILADQRLVLARDDSDPGTIARPDRRRGRDQAVLDRIDRHAAAMTEHAQHPVDMKDIVPARRRKIGADRIGAAAEAQGDDEAHETVQPLHPTRQFRPRQPPRRPAVE